MHFCIICSKSNLSAFTQKRTLKVLHSRKYLHSNQEDRQGDSSDVRFQPYWQHLIKGFKVQSSSLSDVKTGTINSQMQEDNYETTKSLTGLLCSRTAGPAPVLRACFPPSPKSGISVHPAREKQGSLKTSSPTVSCCISDQW